MYKLLTILQSSIQPRAFCFWHEMPPCSFVSNLPETRHGAGAAGKARGSWVNRKFFGWSGGSLKGCHPSSSRPSASPAGCLKRAEAEEGCTEFQASTSTRQPTWRSCFLFHDRGGSARFGLGFGYAHVLGPSVDGPERVHLQAERAPALQQMSEAQRLGKHVYSTKASRRCSRIGCYSSTSPE
jgi:hypothetical protein